MIDQFRAALPGAEILVFDNNSTDGTAHVARVRGVRVQPVAEQGKGHVVARCVPRCWAIGMSSSWSMETARTRPSRAACWWLRCSKKWRIWSSAPVSRNSAPVPCRRSEAWATCCIRAAFRVLIGKGTGDLLSGYRAFSPKFLRTVSLNSEGFEIETELAIEAVTRTLGTLEVSVPYRPRIAGTVSKLNAFRDGRRIFKTIVIHGLAPRSGAGDPGLWRRDFGLAAPGMGDRSVLQLSLARVALSSAAGPGLPRTRRSLTVRTQRKAIVASQRFDRVNH